MKRTARGRETQTRQLSLASSVAAAEVLHVGVRVVDDIVVVVEEDSGGGAGTGRAEARADGSQ